MAEAHEPGDEGGDAAGLFVVLFSAFTAVVLLAVVALTMAPSLRPSGRSTAATPPVAAADGPAIRAGYATVIYVVPTETEAESLRQAFNDWDQAIIDEGLQPSDIARLVLVQTIDESAVRLASDLSVFAGGGAGVQVIDLRREP